MTSLTVQWYRLFQTNLECFPAHETEEGHYPCCLLTYLPSDGNILFAEDANAVFSADRCEFPLLVYAHTCTVAAVI